MTQYAYSPDTGELINTNSPAAWMGTTTIAPPAFNPAVEGCFWKNGVWAIVSALPQILVDAQAVQIATLAVSYNAAIQLPVAYMGTTFQADSPSQDVLTKCLVAGSVPSGFFWLDANNAQISMTYAQLQGLASAMLAQGQVAFAKLQGLKTQVKAATTVAAAQSVVW